MHLPQDDIVPLHEPFETTLRGFNRQQVLDHIESLEGRLSMISADRESALAQVAELSRTLDHLRAESQLLAHFRQAGERAKEQLAHIQQSPILGASVRIQRMVQLAEEEAAELRARAEREIAELKARAEREIAELKARAEREIAELKARTAQELIALRKRATSETEALLRDTTQRCQQLAEDSEQRRKAAEQATAQDITRRECAANARIQSREQRSMAGLQLMMKIIGWQLAERICVVERKEAHLAELCTQANQQLSALEALRAKITTQLTTTRQVLAQALEQIQQTEFDPPELPQPVPIQRGGRAAAEQTTERATRQLR